MIEHWFSVRECKVANLLIRLWFLVLVFRWGLSFLDSDSTGEYMSLPASQYSVLDAERIERVDDSTFRCYVYRIKFFAFEVCPVLLVRVEEQPNGCCIRLLSCKVRVCTLISHSPEFSLFYLLHCHIVAE